MASNAELGGCILFTSFIANNYAIAADGSANAHLSFHLSAIPASFYLATATAAIVVVGVVIIAFFAASRLKDSITTNITALRISNAINDHIFTLDVIRRRD